MMHIKNLLKNAVMVAIVEAKLTSPCSSNGHIMSAPGEREMHSSCARKHCIAVVQIHQVPVGFFSTFQSLDLGRCTLAVENVLITKYQHSLFTVATW